MSLFGFGKKKEEKEAPCCKEGCNTEKTTWDESTQNKDMDIKVLGSGCAKCNELEEAVKAALAEMGLDTAVDHVADFAQIAAYGVMTTPALVVNKKVLSYGKVLKKDEVLTLLKKVME